nr:Scr1 family TA system antitoxin-like transcriptional regulator [Micromonospora sp. DSM 115978]
TFTFILLESVLRYQVTSAAAMIAQLDFIRDVAGRANVSVMIVPDGADLFIPTISSVEIFDERQALAETLIGIQPYTSPSDIDSLIKIVSYLERVATSEIDEIIAANRQRYVAQLVGR